MLSNNKTGLVKQLQVHTTSDNVQKQTIQQIMAMSVRRGDIQNLTKLFMHASFELICHTQMQPHGRRVTSSHFSQN